MRTAAVALAHLKDPGALVEAAVKVSVLTHHGPRVAVASLRNEGRMVLLHCAAAQSRTPAVAVAASMIRGVPFDTALADVRRALPSCSPNPAFLATLKELDHHG